MCIFFRLRYDNSFVYDLPPPQLSSTTTTSSFPTTNTSTLPITTTTTTHPPLQLSLLTTSSPPPPLYPATNMYRNTSTPNHHYHTLPPLPPTIPFLTSKCLRLRSLACDISEQAGSGEQVIRKSKRPHYTLREVTWPEIGVRRAVISL